jgi:hypothetical protein
MPYTVRVELVDAAEPDYTVLNDAMRASGFTRTISGNGVRFKLPTGEYRYESVSDLNTITELVKAAAGKTQRSYGLLISEAVHCMMYGLQPDR